MSQQKKALTLTIPEPCGENFNAMTPVKGGKFCGSCEKTIVDFRTMSDGQILNFYKKSNGKICGVFAERQLNRAMPFPMEVKPNRNWKAVAALTAGLMFSGGLMAQSTMPTVGKIVVVEQSIGKKATDKNETSTPNRIVRGVVKDAENEPLIGANVMIKGITIGVATDFDGLFEIAIPADLTEVELEISYTGFETQTLLFNKKYPFPDKKIEIELTAGLVLGEMIMGIVAYHPGEVAPICETKVEETDNLIEINPDLQAKGIPAENQMTIYPNPFVEDFKVEYKFATKGDYLFHLYDTNGRLLFAKLYHLAKGKQTVELDIATQKLVDGVYILQISDERDMILATKKVFKGQS